MVVGATFGNRDTGAPGAFEKIYDVTKEGDNVDYDYIDLAPDSTYLVVRNAYTISTGKVYGHGLYLVSTPGPEVAGTVAATQVSFAGAGNTGISISFPSTGQIQWRCSSTSYRVRVCVFKIN